MKLAIDTGNSSVKGNLLTNDNKLIKHILIPSAVNNITDEKYLTFDNNEVYFKVIDSSLNHFDDITCVGDYALAKPNYKEYDVTSSSYKSNHKITTALLFGSFIDEVNDNTTLTVTASVPIVEAKTLGLIDKYTELLKGVIQEKVNKIPEIKESTESIKQNEENTEENIVKQEIITEKTAENIVTEPKKEDETVVIQKSERKYPEEVTKRSLGIGIKLK